MSTFVQSYRPWPGSFVNAVATRESRECAVDSAAIYLWLSPAKVNISHLQVDSSQYPKREQANGHLFNLNIFVPVFTALARAMKLAVFVATRQALGLVIRNVENTARQTALVELLIGNINCIHVVRKIQMALH